MFTPASFVEPTAFSGLNDFSAQFNSDGFALPSRYEVIINGSGYGIGDSRKVSLNCHSVIMPGRTLTNFTDINMHGIHPDIVDGISFGEGKIEMSFYASSDLQERVFFESWQEMAWDRETWNVGYYQDYTTPMEIYILDNKNNRRFGIKCHECYPLVIGQTQLDYSPAESVIKIPVTMQYKYWETLDVNNQPDSHSKQIPDWVSGGANRTINANIPTVIRLMA